MMWFIKSDILIDWWGWMAAAGLGVMLITVRRRVAGNACQSQASLNGKTVLVTGASSGIGKATALELAKRGARVIMACRNLCKAKQAAQDIRRQTGCGQLIVRKLDLSSMQSVRDFATRTCQEEEFIHVLINNAGLYQYDHELTDDGLEMHMAVNHFGHFLLVHLLLDKLKASVPSRVIIVSSGLNKYGHIDFENLNGRTNEKSSRGYSDSKLANNLFARELARRTQGLGVSIYCLRPGMVLTDLGRNAPYASVLRYTLWPLLRLLMKNPYEGCQTVLHCAMAEELQDVTGRFYANCAEEPWTKVSLDDEVALRLWNVSEELTGINITAK